eukprot:855445-Prymnesium_polylepis.1
MLRCVLQNEIVLDRWEAPWEPELAEMVEAVLISATASPKAMASARAVHAAVVALIAEADPSWVS